MIGTGSLRYARAFAEEHDVRFPVLVDDRARAAKAAAVRRVGFLKLFDPASYPGSAEAWRAGYRVGWPGRRTNQLGASFVIGPGSVLHYAHQDAHTADHAPFEQIFTALRS